MKRTSDWSGRWNDNGRLLAEKVEPFIKEMMDFAEANDISFRDTADLISTIASNNAVMRTAFKMCED